MSGMKCSSDPKCVELARYFLAHVDGDNVSEADVATLSVAIHDAAETWIGAQPNKEPKCPE